MNDKPQVGQEVRLFDANGTRFYGWNPDGEPGTITKVGRTLVTIESPRIQRGSAQFYIEGGRIKDAYGHTTYLTVQEAEMRLRRQAAIRALRDHGVTIESKSQLTTEQIEALLAVLTDTEES